jgi:hypothetical protein
MFDSIPFAHTKVTEKDSQRFEVVAEKKDAPVSGGEK